MDRDINLEDTSIEKVLKVIRLSEKFRENIEKKGYRIQHNLRAYNFRVYSYNSNTCSSSYNVLGTLYFLSILNTSLKLNSINTT